MKQFPYSNSNKNLHIKPSYFQAPIIANISNKNEYLNIGNINLNSTVNRNSQSNLNQRRKPRNLNEDEDLKVLIQNSFFATSEFYQVCQGNFNQLTSYFSLLKQKIFPFIINNLQKDIIFNSFKDIQTILTISNKNLQSFHNDSTILIKKFEIKRKKLLLNEKKNALPLTGNNTLLYNSNNNSVEKENKTNRSFRFRSNSPSFLTKDIGKVPSSYRNNNYFFNIKLILQKLKKFGDAIGNNSSNNLKNNFTNIINDLFKEIQKIDFNNNINTINKNSQISSLKNININTNNNNEFKNLYSSRSNQNILSKTENNFYRKKNNPFINSNINNTSINDLMEELKKCQTSNKNYENEIGSLKCQLEYLKNYSETLERTLEEKNSSNNTQRKNSSMNNINTKNNDNEYSSKDEINDYQNNNNSQNKYMSTGKLTKEAKLKNDNNDKEKDNLISKYISQNNELKNKNNEILIINENLKKKQLDMINDKNILLKQIEEYEKEKTDINNLLINANKIIDEKNDINKQKEQEIMSLKEEIKKKEHNIKSLNNEIIKNENQNKNSDILFQSKQEEYEKILNEKISLITELNAKIKNLIEENNQFKINYESLNQKNKIENEKMNTIVSEKEEQITNHKIIINELQIKLDEYQTQIDSLNNEKENIKNTHKIFDAKNLVISSEEKSKLFIENNNDKKLDLVKQEFTEKINILTSTIAKNNMIIEEKDGIINQLKQKQATNNNNSISNSTNLETSIKLTTLNNSLIAIEEEKKKLLKEIMNLKKENERLFQSNLELQEGQKNEDQIRQLEQDKLLLESEIDDLKKENEKLKDNDNKSVKSSQSRKISKTHSDLNQKIIELVTELESEKSKKNQLIKEIQIKNNELEGLKMVIEKLTKEKENVFLKNINNNKGSITSSNSANDKEKIELENEIKNCNIQIEHLTKTFTQEIEELRKENNILNTKIKKLKEEKNLLSTNTDHNKE